MMYDFRRSETLLTPSHLADHVRLPSFVCIGAPKCATTWLFGCMLEHPGVFLPDFKEVNFFTVCRWGDDYERRGVDYYTGLFAGAQPDQVIGDFSPNLLQDPYAPERLKALLPDARLIVMIRNPIARSRSHYHYVRNRSPHLPYSLRDVLDDPSRDHAGYLSQGLYGEQLEHWLGYFARDRFLVLTTEDVRESPEAAFRRACEHVGIDASYEPAALEDRANAAKTLRFRSFYGWNLKASRFLNAHGLDSVRTVLKRAGLPQLVQRLNESPVNNPPLTPEETRDLASFYREDNARLSRLLDRDFSSWLEVPGRE